MRSRKPVSSFHPALYMLSILARRTTRWMDWILHWKDFSGSIERKSLPILVTEHRSLLLRKLAGTDPVLQRNKVESLRNACACIDGILVRPGETFSFWRLVGMPTEGRGFRPGLQLSFGELVQRTGGGLCQLSNLLHWMVLHTPMSVTERHRHDTDPFPDYRRTVPFGSGATVFYNYLDLMFRNGSDQVFQIRTWLEGEYLRGEMRSRTHLSTSYVVEERDHRFIRTDEGVFRENSLWRKSTDTETGRCLSEELLMENHSRVGYDPDDIKGLEVMNLTSGEKEKRGSRSCPAE